VEAITTSPSQASLGRAPGYSPKEESNKGLTSSRKTSNESASPSSRTTPSADVSSNPTTQPPTLNL
ncbi:unnamed protein product, partial [Musa hybrid cultivar]